MLETVKIPEHDRFQVILEQSKDNLIADENYMNIARTGNSVFVEITLRRGRSTEVKRHSTAGLQSASLQIPAYLRKIVIVLTENDDADWSFGMGEAQYVK